jgi:hypothetical protein
MRQIGVAYGKWRALAIAGKALGAPYKGKLTPQGKLYGPDQKLVRIAGESRLFPPARLKRATALICSELYARAVEDAIGEPLAEKPEAMTPALLSSHHRFKDVAAQWWRIAESAASHF